MKVRNPHCEACAAPVESDGAGNWRHVFLTVEQEDRLGLDLEARYAPHVAMVCRECE